MFSVRGKGDRWLVATGAILDFIAWIFKGGRLHGPKPHPLRKPEKKTLGWHTLKANLGLENLEIENINFSIWPLRFLPIPLFFPPSWAPRHFSFRSCFCVSANVCFWPSVILSFSIYVCPVFLSLCFQRSVVFRIYDLFNFGIFNILCFSTFILTEFLTCYFSVYRSSAFRRISYSVLPYVHCSTWNFSSSCSRESISRRQRKETTDTNQRQQIKHKGWEPETRDNKSKLNYGRNASCRRIAYLPLTKKTLLKWIGRI